MRETSRPRPPNPATELEPNNESLEFIRLGRERRACLHSRSLVVAATGPQRPLPHLRPPQRAVTEASARRGPTPFSPLTTIAKITPSRRAEHWKMGMMPNSPCSQWPDVPVLCLHGDMKSLPRPQKAGSLNLPEENEVAQYATKGKLNTLTGFNSPYGECVDAKGSTWITNFTGASVVEYMDAAARSP